MINIAKNITIPESEINFRFGASSGPGGQNVNKVSTRATLLFDIANSPSLTDKQKERISIELKTRINKKGVLRVVSQKYRSQAANREAAIEKFRELLQNALQEKPRRKSTKIPKRAHEKRLAEKKRRSRLKRERSGVGIDKC
ncbi:MAG: aminoacyl-tRNA hydrolase [candidate division Zixibacteria bacterium]|nr:aminoacyl-tRNA hydrolase [candidate division Zixibacteria bacterium]